MKVVCVSQLCFPDSEKVGDEHQLWADMTSGPRFCRYIGTFYMLYSKGKRVGKGDSESMAGGDRSLEEL